MLVLLLVSPQPSGYLSSAKLTFLIATLSKVGALSCCACVYAPDNPPSSSMQSGISSWPKLAQSESLLQKSMFGLEHSGRCNLECCGVTIFFLPLAKEPGKKLVCKQSNEYEWPHGRKARWDILEAKALPAWPFSVPGPLCGWPHCCVGVSWSSLPFIPESWLIKLSFHLILHTPCQSHPQP